MSTTEIDLSVRPYQVAKDTFIIPQLMEAPPVGLFYVNSMVITGSEPVIVDTGTISHRQQWLNDVFELVEPADVRWIFLTHDDPDHAGNLRQVMDACPHATLLTTWFSIGRMSVDHVDGWIPPLDRCRFVNDDDTFDAGDRVLAAVRPPFFDNPTTRGLFDATTGVYWSVDSFGTTVPGPVIDAAEMDHAEWVEGTLLVNRLNHPWFLWLDEAKFHRYVDRVQGLGISTIAGCHAPALYGRMVGEAFDLIRGIPSMQRWAEPTQADLESWLAAATTAPAGSHAP